MDNTVYMNVEDYVKSSNRRETSETKPSGEIRSYRAAVLGLGLLSVLLLAGITGCCIYYQGVLHRLEEISFKGRDLLKTSLLNLTEDRDLLKTSLLNLTEDRDLLKTSLLNLTEDRDLLKTSLLNLTEDRDQLKTSLLNLTEDRDQLKTSLLKLTEGLKVSQNHCCPDGWRKFGCSCYFLSKETKSWEESRQDCRRRGADLVVIGSYEEQEFMATFRGKTWVWIGLSDRDAEGSWKWVDGTALTTEYWRPKQPDNGGGDPQWGEEDCAYSSTTNPKSDWNDLSCNTAVEFVCEIVSCQ